MLILVLLGMYFDAVVVFVTSQTLLFRLALAILCKGTLLLILVWKVYNFFCLCWELFLSQIFNQQIEGRARFSSGVACWPTAGQRRARP